MRYTDPIANQYVRLVEMAELVDRDVSLLSKNIPTPGYDKFAARLTNMIQTPDGFRFGKEGDDNHTKYITTDQSGKTMHISVFAKGNLGPSFDHQYQSLADQSPKIPPGYTRNLMIHHIKNSNLPLLRQMNRRKKVMQCGGNSFHKQWNKVFMSIIGTERICTRLRRRI